MIDRALIRKGDEATVGVEDWIGHGCDSAVEALWNPSDNGLEV
jgi:hypothetical protein